MNPIHKQLGSLLLPFSHGDTWDLSNRYVAGETHFYLVLGMVGTQDARELLKVQDHEEN